MQRWRVLKFIGRAASTNGTNIFRSFIPDFDNLNVAHPVSYLKRLFNNDKD